MVGMKNELTTCQRCGTCCRKGPPGLHTQDKKLYDQGILRKEHLLTLRKGEWVYENIKDQRIVLAEEMIRIRSKKSEAACLFFNGLENSCDIYGYRPLECRVLQCWDPSGILDIYAENRLGRSDLFAPDSALLGIVMEHEKRCPYDRVAELSGNIKGKTDPESTDLAELAEMIRLDLGMREALRDRTGADDLVLEFLFGRSLSKTLPTFGLEVRETREGYRFVKRDL